MFRRGVCLLVVVGLIAGQPVSPPHAHGEMSAVEKREHDATPHFHCSGTGHSHHHGHSRGPHSHSHSGHTHGLPPSVAVPKATPDGVNRRSHDEDAVYILPPPLAMSVTQSPADTSKVHADDWSVDVLSEELNDVQWTACWHPPDQFRKSAGLYLVLRNLRI